MNIVIFGGSFNPVHREHVALAKAAVKKFKPQKFIIVPTSVSPHKSGTFIAPAEDRLEMCRLAFSDIPCAEVSDYEIASGGVSYSYITCEHFRSLYPQAELYFLMGGDMLASFPSWKNPERILACVTLAAGARESMGELKKSRSEVERTFCVKVERVHYTGAKVSSTRVRTLACLGEKNGRVCFTRCSAIYKEQGAVSQFKPCPRGRTRKKVALGPFCQGGGHVRRKRASRPSHRRAGHRYGRPARRY